MSIRDLLREAFHSLESNKGRSLLTILGIVIGISAVIAMTSLIGGIRNNLVGSMGLNAGRLITMYSYEKPLTTEKLDQLSKIMPQYEEVVGSITSWTEVTSGDKTISLNITGAPGKYLEFSGTASNLREGRLFTEQDEEDGLRVVILDQWAARFFFNDDSSNVIGRSVTFGNHTYSVIGVVETMYGSEEWAEVYLPLKTAQQDFDGGSTNVDNAVGLVREGFDIDEVTQETLSSLATILRIDEDEIEDSLYLFSLQSAIDQLDTFMSIFQFLMGSVAGISLLVGGIGIMNMMLTNVTERIREIGIRRALGATERDITLQFLAESAALCVTGGIIGTILGYALAWVLTFIANSSGLIEGVLGTSAALTPSISLSVICFSVGISIFIGIAFGYYPARRAAKLDPIECLRYQ